MLILKAGDQTGHLMGQINYRIFTYFSLPNMVFESSTIFKLETFAAAQLISMTIDTMKNLSLQSLFGHRYENGNFKNNTYMYVFSNKIYKNVTWVM